MSETIPAAALPAKWRKEAEADDRWVADAISDDWHAAADVYRTPEWRETAFAGKPSLDATPPPPVAGSRAEHCTNCGASWLDDGLNKLSCPYCELASRDREIEGLKQELETERMRLAACGVAAIQNTPESATQRITDDNPYWSASYSDVCRAVDREMALRAQATAARRLAEGFRKAAENYGGDTPVAVAFATCADKLGALFPAETSNG